MTPAQETAQAVKVLVAIVAAVIVGFGVYGAISYQQHRAHAECVDTYAITGDKPNC